MIQRCFRGFITIMAREGEVMTKVIILEDLNFMWDIKDLDITVRLWKEGKSLFEIAKILKCDTDEAWLVLMHLSREGRIRKRKNGLFGEVA